MTRPGAADVRQMADDVDDTVGGCRALNTHNSLRLRFSVLDIRRREVFNSFFLIFIDLEGLVMAIYHTVLHLDLDAKGSWFSDVRLLL